MTARPACRPAPEPAPAEERRACAGGSRPPGWGSTLTTDIPSRSWARLSGEPSVQSRNLRGSVRGRVRVVRLLGHPPTGWRPSRDSREPTGYPCPATASQSSGWAWNGCLGGRESAGSGVSRCSCAECLRVKPVNVISVVPFLRVGPKVVVQTPESFGGWVRAAFAPGPPSCGALDVVDVRR